MISTHVLMASQLLLLLVMSSGVESTGTWIDPDTSANDYTTDSHPTTSRPSNMPSASPSATPSMVARNFQLVFSDEFNTPGRTFGDGKDPRWTALDKNDYTNDALHYYSPDNAVTNDDGWLVIKTEPADTEVVGFDDVKRENTIVTKHFKSAMLQTWNKFCFTGGIIEAQVILPGKHNVGGLWPAFWMLGNLARHTFVGSAEHVWPWSSTTCTTKSRTAQAISGCANIAHYGMEKRFGRGAPEIDIFEVQPGATPANKGAFFYMPVGQPFMSASYQVAPGRPVNRPGPGLWPGPGQWYEGLKGGENTSVNILFYGNYNAFLSDVDPAKQDYWSDAISYNRQLFEDHFEKPHIYRVEWEPPSDVHDGYIHWFLDGSLVLAINGTGVEAAGLGGEVSSEPMYILLNTAISKQWGFPAHCPEGCACKEFDCHDLSYGSQCGFSEGFCDMMKTIPEYKIDWVRVYQDVDNKEHKVGCSTPERPTRQWIQAHEKLYKTDADVHPLKEIQVGRGKCNPRDIGTPSPTEADLCGGPTKGQCRQGGICECNAGWTGPHCLAHLGSDPIVYDAPDRISDLGFIPPTVPPFALLVGLGALVVMLLVNIQWRTRLDGWTPFVASAAVISEEEKQ